MGSGLDVVALGLSVVGRRVLGVDLPPVGREHLGRVRGRVRVRVGDRDRVRVGPSWSGLGSG